MTPPERLADQLIAERRSGASFADAWERALGVAIDGAYEAGMWRSALEATRAEWEASWHRLERPRPVRALVAVRADPERVALDPDEQPEPCEHCGGKVRSKPNGRSVLYCSGKCRRDASALRVASAREAA